VDSALALRARNTRDVKPLISKFAEELTQNAGSDDSKSRFAEDDGTLAKMRLDALKLNTSVEHATENWGIGTITSTMEMNDANLAQVKFPEVGKETWVQFASLKLVASPQKPVTVAPLASNNHAIEPPAPRARPAEKPKPPRRKTKLTVAEKVLKWATAHYRKHPDLETLPTRAIIAKQAKVDVGQVIHSWPKIKEGLMGSGIPNLVTAIQTYEKTRAALYSEFDLDTAIEFIRKNIVRARLPIDIQGRMARECFESTTVMIHNHWNEVLIGLVNTHKERLVKTAIHWIQDNNEHIPAFELAVDEYIDWLSEQGKGKAKQLARLQTLRGEKAKPVHVSRKQLARARFAEMNWTKPNQRALATNHVARKAVKLGMHTWLTKTLVNHGLKGKEDDIIAIIERGHGPIIPPDPVPFFIGDKQLQIEWKALSAKEVKLTVSVVGEAKTSPEKVLQGTGKRTSSHFAEHPTIGGDMPGSALIYFVQQAKNALARGDHVSSLKFCTKVYAATPKTSLTEKNIEACTDLMMLLSKLEEYETAIELSNTVLASDSKCLMAHCVKAASLHQLGRKEEGDAAFREAQRQIPDFGKKMAVALRDVGQKIAAVSSVLQDSQPHLSQTGATSPPGEEEFLRLMRRAATLMQAGNLDGAEGLLNQAREIKPDAEAVYLNLGNLFLLRRNYTQAARHFQKSVELNPDYHMGYLSLGQFMLRRLNDPSGAILTLTKAIEAIEKEIDTVGPHSNRTMILIQSLIIRAEAYEKQGQTSNAIADRARIQELQSRFAENNEAQDRIIPIETIYQDNKLNVVLLERLLSEEATAILKEKAGRDNVRMRIRLVGSAKYLCDRQGWCPMEPVRDIDVTGITASKIEGIDYKDIAHSALAAVNSRILGADAKPALPEDIFARLFNVVSWHEDKRDFSEEEFEILKLIANETEPWHLDEAAVRRIAKRYISLLYYFGDREIYQKYRAELLERYNDPASLRKWLLLEIKQQSYIQQLKDDLGNVSKKGHMLARLQTNAPWLLGEPEDGFEVGTARFAEGTVKKVLIADDTPKKRKAAEEAVRAKWPNLTELVIVKGGTGATKALEDGGFDIVILDINMPKPSGLAISQDLKKPGTALQKANPDVVVVINSANRVNKNIRPLSGLDFERLGSSWDECLVAAEAKVEENKASKFAEEHADWKRSQDLDRSL